MALLSLMSQIIRAVRHRQAIQSMTELDDHMLADIGLLRSDVYASLARPYFTDPSKALRDACCHWRSRLSLFHRSSDTVACC
jgi:uncharacterized protein YjiS (DUF1127 family)